ncbi:hypothetical protein [Arcticibacter sp. MXS-1]|uniref:hypothetical protein n=1 Tax=Arcticibacter sp. MXS-1 TaxID=3341726 RepID=UPI0035A8822D
MLNRVIAILLLSTLLVTQTELGQLIKFPILITHYFDHKSEKPDISVIAFIKLHYFSKFVKDKDYMEDMRLPFKSNTTIQVLSVSSAVIPQNSYISIRAAEFDLYRVRPDFSEKEIRGVAKSVWQPPQYS